MKWRTTKVDISDHVFHEDVDEVDYAIDWCVTDMSTGRMVVGIRNARLCVRNDKLDVVVRVRSDIDEIDNEHEILNVLNHITGTTIRSLV